MGQLVAEAAAGDLVSIIANPTIRDIGAVGLLLLVAMMIFTGRLIPKATHLREIAAADKQTAAAIVRGDEWKATAEETAAVNKTIRHQNGELIEANKVVKALLQASGPSIADTQQPMGGV